MDSTSNLKPADTYTLPASVKASVTLLVQGKGKSITVQKLVTGTVKLIVEGREVSESKAGPILREILKLV